MLVGDASGKVDVASVGIDDITPVWFMETCKITVAGMGNSWLSRAELDDNIASIMFTGYYF